MRVRLLRYDLIKRLEALVASLRQLVLRVVADRCRSIVIECVRFHRSSSRISEPRSRAHVTFLFKRLKRTDKT